MAPVNDALTYDEAFAELESVLQDLEGGDLPLERALALYEQGVALSTFCAHKLEEAELRVRQWQPGEQTAPFEGWQEG